MQEMIRTQVRIPKDLADWLKQKAKEQNRSMNSQLIQILEQQKQQGNL